MAHICEIWLAELNNEQMDYNIMKHSIAQKTSKNSKSTILFELTTTAWRKENS